MVIGRDNASVNFWANTGFPQFVFSPLGDYAAGVRFADLDGDGVDDFISVGENGEALAYLNGGQSGDGWNWNLVHHEISCLHGGTDCD